MSAFRLGLVGAGRMGRTHMRALAASQAVRVVALADPDPGARALGPAAHGDLPAMLRAGGLDGVLVAVPTGMHVATIGTIAAAGLPILCEKPLGFTAAQVRAALAAAGGQKLQVAYWRRFVPALAELRARIQAGGLGTLTFLACHQWDHEPPARAFRATSGGIFVDMAVHEFDMMRWLSGADIAAVMSVAGAAGAEPPLAGDAETAQALCTLSSGATALAAVGRHHRPGYVCRVEAYGTADAADCRFVAPPHGDDVLMDALRRQAEAFAAWVRGGPSQGATGEDAVAALVAAEAASRALPR